MSAGFVRQAPQPSPRPESRRVASGGARLRTPLLGSRRNPIDPRLFNGLFPPPRNRQQKGAGRADARPMPPPYRPDFLRLCRGSPTAMRSSRHQRNSDRREPRLSVASGMRQRRSLPGDGTRQPCCVKASAASFRAPLGGKPRGRSCRPTASPLRTRRARPRLSAPRSTPSAKTCASRFGIASFPKTATLTTTLPSTRWRHSRQPPCLRTGSPRQPRAQTLQQEPSHMVRSQKSPYDDTITG